ncbi:MAG: hypothetical protein LBU86_02700 [Oscillospiraceae bacterium]|jgi:hypothetical protein|nr:hypothetical protein [Oscillospiraceae bacterium]
MSNYNVVWPLGKLGVQKSSLAPRLPDLNGKTICELSHMSYRGDDIFPALRVALKKRYPDIKFVTYETFGNFRDPRVNGYELEKHPGLKELLEKEGCDAIIAGVAA